MDLDRDCTEGATFDWPQLLSKTPRKIKLVVSVAFYKTSEKVCHVLDCLEQDYQREDDWCGGADNLHPKCEADLTLRIRKHLEQKEVLQGSNDTWKIVLQCYIFCHLGVQYGQENRGYLLEVHGKGRCQDGNAESR
ncbi:triple functional domain protein-like isoform X1 [Festucalex cinctus]